MVGLAGCRGSAPAGGAAKTYPVRGTVVSTDAARGEVLLDHEAIPGFMEAMTMSYQLRDPSIVSELHAGDRITATLLVSHGGESRKI